MKTTLIMVGKTTNKMYSEAIDDYCRRIGHYTPFNIKVIPELKNAKSLSESQQKEKEGELILKCGKPQQGGPRILIASSAPAREHLPHR